MSWHVGDRIRHVDGFRGTVRFVGPLQHRPAPANEEIWIGVEWDCDNCGKNDGSIENHRYFKCPHGRGSFLKENSAKVQSTRGLLATLASRYSTEEDSGDASCARGHTKYRTHGADPFLRDPDTGAFVNVKQTDCQANFELSCIGYVEADPHVTWDPQCPYAQMLRANLSPSKRSYAQHTVASTPCVGADGLVHGTLQTWFPNLGSLVLKETLLNSWSDVKTVCQSLSALHTLNVSLNPLGPIDLSLGYRDGAREVWSPSITVFSAAGVGCDHATVGVLCAVLPSLQEFNLGFNDAIGSEKSLAEFSATWCRDPLTAGLAEAAMQTLQSLQTLLIESTATPNLQHLVNWLDVFCYSPVGAHDSPFALTKLKMSDNYVDSIAILDSAKAEKYFGRVKTLWMRNTSFHCWDDFTEVIPLSLPAMEDLIFSDDGLIQSSVPGDGTQRGPQHSVDSPFNLLTLERFRFTVAALPKQVKRLNNSTITDKELLAADQLVLSKFLLPFSEKFNGSIEDAAAAKLCPRKMLRLLEQHYKEMRDSDGKVRVYVPKPRFKKDEYAVHLVTLICSFEELCRYRLDQGFDGALRSQLGDSPQSLSVEELNRRSRDARRAVVDVRWTVQQLREHIMEITGLGATAVNPLKFFEGRHEDHWTAAELALIACSIPAPDSEAHERRKFTLSRMPVPMNKLFPSKSVVLFHYDMELAENHGAKEKGLHCKHLVRPLDKLYEHRVADGDAIIVVSLT